MRGKRGVKLELVVDHVEGRRQLPIVELRRAVESVILTLEFGIE